MKKKVGKCTRSLENNKDRVVCPNFGHPALTSSFTKYEFLQVKNSFATILNKLSVFKLFQLSNGDFINFVACLQHLQSA